MRLSDVIAASAAAALTVQRPDGSFPGGPRPGFGPGRAGGHPARWWVAE